jgi:hypothetical protein
MSKFSQRLDMQMDVSSQGILQPQPLKLDFLDALSPRPNVDPLTDPCNQSIPGLNACKPGQRIRDRGPEGRHICLVGLVTATAARHLPAAALSVHAGSSGRQATGHVHGRSHPDGSVALLVSLCVGCPHLTNFVLIRNIRSIRFFSKC